MTALDRLLRRGFVRGRPYHPFSQPSYSGGYNLGSAGQQRAANAGSNIPVAASYLKYSPARPKSTLYLYEDRRLWHPLGANALPKSKTQTYPRVVDYTPIRIVPSDPDPFFPKPARIPYRGPLKIPRGHDYYGQDDKLNITRSYPLTWSNPYDMIICLKRKIRREIAHAMGFAGAYRNRKPRYTQFSFVRCR